MTLLIAVILIYAFKLHWVWYIPACVIYLVTLLIKARLLSMQDEMHTEIIEKIESQNVNIISAASDEMPEWYKKEKRYEARRREAERYRS